MEINRTITTTIDRDKCVACGECVKVCPKDTISIINKKAEITGVDSLVCDHCRAVCSSGAISVGGIDRTLSNFNSFSVSDKWLPFGSYDTPGLVNLMQSRRSCRNFKDKPVEKELLEDLVKIGVTAPSGSNCQQWTFTVLPKRPDVLLFGQQIQQYFAKLNSLAENILLRSALKLIGKPDLAWYYSNYYQQIKEGLKEWEEKGTDNLFHGASAVIVVSSLNSASCPSEDALLATQNILLGAHSIGLGTCLIGFAVKAMNKDKTIRRFIGLAEDEDPYAVIAIGYPNEKYRIVTGRKPVTIRYYGQQD